MKKNTPERDERAAEKRRDACVYAITNTVNGKRYIGSARHFVTRVAIHRRELRAGEHHSVKLQYAWNKYGEQAFRFDVLLICSPDDRLFYEQRLLDGFGCVKNGYNVLPTAGSNAGFRHTEETKARIGAANKGRKYGPEVREQMRQRQLGKARSDETKAKLRAAFTGRKMSRESIEKRLAHPVSEATKAKIAENMRRIWAERRAAA